jgi:DNA-binding response OmpR family regulator
VGSLKNRRVLIIDDEQQMCHLVGTVLKKEDADVFMASDGAEGLRKLYEVQPDLVLLDVLMPRMSGWEVLARIREMTDVPVIMLTVLNGGDNEARALRGGANDYITKPFNANALIARIEAALRGKRSSKREDAYDDGYLSLDSQRRQVTVNGEKVHLTRREYELLEFLMTQNGNVCTYEMILDEVWGGQEQSSADNVHVFVWQLRQKIEPDPGQPTYIVNVPSVGYVFGGRLTGRR